MDATDVVGCSGKAQAAKTGWNGLDGLETCRMQHFGEALVSSLY